MINYHDIPASAWAPLNQVLANVTNCQPKCPVTCQLWKIVCWTWNTDKTHIFAHTNVSVYLLFNVYSRVKFHHFSPQRRHIIVQNASFEPFEKTTVQSDRLIYGVAVAGLWEHCRQILKTDISRCTLQVNAHNVSFPPHPQYGFVANGPKRKI